MSFLKRNWFLILINAFFGIILLVTVLWLIIGPQILIRNGKTTIKTNDVFFYIPSLTSIKVYKLESNISKLQKILEDDTKSSDATFGIYIKNLNTNQEVSLNPETEFDSASLYKLALMYAIYYNSSQGKLDIKDQDIQNNLKQMITVSSNQSAYWFIDQNLTSWDQITELVQEIGMEKTFLNKGQPTTTPKDMGLFLEQLANGQLVSPEDSLEMLSLLSDQEVNDRIPVLLPKGTLIAHKTGDLEDVTHDVGIIAGPSSDYIIVLMSKDSTDPAKSKKIMQKISLDIYNFFENQFQNPAEIL